MLKKTVEKRTKTYQHQKIEKKWQKKWKEKEIYRATPNKGKSYYTLVELAYASGDLHMGHWFAWSAPDAYVRYKRMQGHNVLFPVGGFDSFGLPAENAAIKKGVHPQDWTRQNIEAMRKQFATMGPSFDWQKEIVTSDPEYYKWTQWLFLQLYKAGLAYRAKITSNWCPKCKTVLANEHVENGCCWRHTGTKVVQRKVEQWLFRLTKYADRLLWPENPKVDWPQSAIEGQNNWIGRKEGIVIKYQVVDSKYKIECWTSRPDTNFGATFIVLAPEHPLALKISTKEQKRKVTKYIEASKRKSERQRLVEAKDKTGIFTGAYAINNLNGERMPIWISDFVLMDFGTGAIVGVPGHDTRDFNFAKKFDLPIRRVVVGPDKDKSTITKIEQVQEGEGVMINSDFLNGLNTHEAIKKIMEYIEKKGWGKRQTVYHLRDWTISRRRYWGAPIPIIYCSKCGIVAVPEKDLPVLLPYKVNYAPTGKAPLATAPDFVNTKCPKCGDKAKRETETMDTYVDSSWYFLRYPNPKYNQGPFDPKEVKKWLPVDIYFGGPEHVLGHTLYARFITKVLYDLGKLPFDEFAEVRRHHGIIFGPDGYRMSKSRGNVVNPDEEVKKYGADSVRLYLCFLGPHGQGGSWSREGIEGAHRFLSRVWRLYNEDYDLVLTDEKDSREILAKQHQTVQKVTKDIEKLHFNTAIASVMEFVNLLREKTKGKIKQARKGIRCAEWDEALRVLAQLLAPFAPHIAEEVWVNILGQKFSIHTSLWPKYDTDLAKERRIVIVVQVNGKKRSQLGLNSNQAKDKAEVIKLAKKDPRSQRWLKGKKIKNTIFVPERIINFVTK